MLLVCSEEAPLTLFAPGRLVFFWIWVAAIWAGPAGAQQFGESACASGPVDVSSEFSRIHVASDSVFEIAGRFDAGPAHDVAVLGDILFYFQGTVLVVADASDREDPVELVRRSFNTSHIHPQETVYPTITIDDSLAYVGVGNTLQILDVSQPSDPHDVGSVDLGLTIGQIRVTEGLAYAVSAILSNPSGMVIVNVSEPSEPEEIGHLLADGLSGETSCPTEFYAVAPTDTIAYLGTSRGVHVIDVRAPADPQELQYVSRPWVSDVGLDDDILYALGASLSAYDVSNPLEPSLLDDVEIGSTSRRLLVRGGYGYVAAGTDGIRTVDLSDPADLHVVETLELPGSQVALSYSNASMFAAAWQEGIQILDIGRPDAPETRGHIAAEDWVRSVGIEGDLAYVAASRAGVLILDVSDPEQSTRLGAHGSGGFIYDVVVAEDLAFAAAEPDIVLIDIGDPSTPTEVGSIDPHGDVSDLIVIDDILYVSVGSALRVIDAGEPEDAETIATQAYCQVWGSCVARMDVDGETNIAILGGTGGRVHLMDVADPGNPEELSQVDFSGDIVDIGLRGEYAYVMTEDTLHVLNVSHRQAPIGGMSLPLGLSTASDLLLVEDEAYVSAGSGGIVVFDLSDPAEPAISGRSSLTGGIHAAGPTGLVYAVSTDGLLLLRRRATDTAVDGRSDPKHPGDEEGALSVYPNPSAAFVTIQYTLASGPATVQIEIFDLLGRRIRTFHHYGRQSVETIWDRRDASGRTVPAGMYLCRIREGSATTAQPVVLQR